MRILSLLLMFAGILFSEDMIYEDFINNIYKNSQDIVMQEAIGRALHNEGKAMNSWESPYVEVSPSFIRNKGANRYDTEAQVLFMITPKMPWVSGIIKESYDIKTTKNAKILELQKNIIEIGAKRSYLSHQIYQEQYEIYKDKEELSRKIYEIAQVRFNANRISKAELTRFKSDHSIALSQLKTQESLLKQSLANLQILVGNPNFSGVVDLDFYYLAPMDLKPKAQDSLYNAILQLDAQDYEKSAKVISRAQMNGLSVGAGYTFGQNSIDVKLVIPLPVTPKANYEQKALMELQSASLRQNELMKQKIAQSVESYKQQLEAQEEIIDLAAKNEENTLELFNIMQKGFDAGAIGVFEYLYTKNSYLDSRIKLTEEKLNYINLLSLLEESIGEALR